MTEEQIPEEMVVEEKLAEKKEEYLSYDDFLKVQLKVGTILSAAKVEKSEKLLQLEVQFGEHDIRQVVSGIAKRYNPEDITGLQFVFVTNLAPRPIMGLESYAMILAADGESGPVLMIPAENVVPGSGLH